MRRSAEVRDALEDHASDVEILGAVLDGALDVGVHDYFLDRGDVVEGDGFAEKAEDVAAAGPA